jgi:hypothetical protein
VASFIVGVFSFMRMILWPVPVLLIFMSVLTARFWVATVAEHEGDIAARRWFVYPPLVAAYALVAGAMISWPLPFVGGAMTDDDAMRARLLKWFHDRSEVAARLIAFGALGVWWLILGPALYRCHRVVHLAFGPFADWFRQRHAVWLTISGPLVTGASAALLFEMLG